jgi:adenosylcobyric acid synthase
VAVRYVTRPLELRAPDLVIVPGSKATIPDLRWLHKRGLADRIRWLADHGTPVLGICGGYQMLGQMVNDPRRLESDQTSAAGLGLLPVETEMGLSKRLVRTRGRVSVAAGVWSCLDGLEVDGYEIHVGHTSALTTRPFLVLPSGPDGCVSSDGLVAGTYVHGLFERAEPRRALIRALAHSRGFSCTPASSPPVDPYDRLADVLAQAIRVDVLARWAATAR